MAFRGFFRGDRERDYERNPDRRRSMGEYSRGERDYRGGEGRYGSREWPPGSEFTEEDWQRYGGRDYGPERYGGRENYGQGFSRPRVNFGQNYGRDDDQRYQGEYNRRYGEGVEGISNSWRDEDRNFGGDYGNRGSGSGVYGRYYGGGGTSGGSYGESGYDRDMDYVRRSALEYGGYDRVGGAATGSARTWEPEQHRGKGPRGYRRSDVRIHEEVCECLTDDPRIDASNVEVTVRECEVTLSGTVNSREEKRRAEVFIERISGVKEVNNNLRVFSEPSPQPPNPSD